MRVRTSVKAGHRMGGMQHNESLVRARKGVPVKTHLKAGSPRDQATGQ